MRNDWVEVRFEALARNLKRGPFGGNLKKEIFVASGYKVYEQQHAIKKDFNLGSYYINEDKFKELESFQVFPNDYIISCAGTIGKIYRLPKDAPVGVMNQALMKLSLNDALILPEYFTYLFESKIFQRKIISDARGTGMQNMAGMKEMKAVSVEIPPLPEQRAIVAKIDELFSELDNGIANLKAAQAKLDIYRQAVLKQAFEAKDVSFEKLDFYSNLITKGASPKWQGFDYVEDSNQLLFITSENVREGFLDLKKEKFLPLSFNEKQKRSTLQKGDVLFNLVGASIGRAAIYNLEKVANINQAVAVIRLKESLLASFLVYWLNSEVAKKVYLEKVVDVARANISLKDVSELSVPAYSIEEQTQIVQEIEARLSVCDKLAETIQTSLQQAEALRQSILKKAFEGRLLTETELQTCKAQADWMPAEQLLAQIKSTKAKG